MIQLSMENFVQYSPMAYDIVSHALTLGFAVMLAALFYFVLTLRTVAPKYRISSVLSVVVMVSAFLILFAQSQSWQNAFVYDAASGTYMSSYALIDPNAEAAAMIGTQPAFTNGFRYLNWLIDVPMLLFQILFVVTITQARRNSLRNIFFGAGALMIVTGYIGQFYEVGEAGGPDMGPFLIWGAISTVFFAVVLWQMYGLIKEARSNMSERAGAWMGRIWWLFLFSWMLYPGAYLAPLLMDAAATLTNPAGAGSVSEAAVVGRQLTFTVADIASKVVYGIFLTIVAQIRSEEDGYHYEKLFGAGDAEVEVTA
jgi:bacteriorhodopsin